MEISKDLKTVFGVKAASYFTIKRCYSEFTTEKRDNNADKPNGRPKSASNDSNVAAVAKLVKEDPHICIREVSAKLALSFGTDEKRVLHKELHPRKLAAKWVPP